MPTGARGEGYIDDGENRVEVLFTNRALMEAERATGKTVMQIARALESDGLGITDVAHLLAVGMEHARREARRLGRHGGRGFNVNDALDLMDRVGWATCTAVVMEALSAVLQYGTGTGDESSADPS